MNERPLTVKEAAEFLSLTPHQLRTYIRDGMLKAYRLGRPMDKKRTSRPWRIWKEDLLEFINRSSNIKEDNR